ncbi:MAG: hypothetical protein ACN6O3_09995 [Comamonas sp.]
MITAAIAMPYLTDAEITEICKPLKTGAAQIRYFKRLGMVVESKPNGHPLVARAEFERVMTGGKADAAPQEKPEACGPNVLGLQDYFQKRKHGSHT